MTQKARVLMAFWITNALLVAAVLVFALR